MGRIEREFLADASMAFVVLVAERRLVGKDRSGWDIERRDRETRVAVTGGR